MEYACRAGDNSVKSRRKRRFPRGKEDDFETAAWYKYNSAKTQPSRTPCQCWGFCDMHGNVREWCWIARASDNDGRNRPKGQKQGASGHRALLR